MWLTASRTMCSTRGSLYKPNELVEVNQPVLSFKNNIILFQFKHLTQCSIINPRKFVHAPSSSTASLHQITVKSWSPVTFHHHHQNIMPKRRTITNTQNNNIILSGNIKHNMLPQICNVAAITSNCSRSNSSTNTKK